MAPEKELLEYHRTRLQNFGQVETNFIEKEKQLYIPWSLAYIVKNIFNVNSFKSLEATIPLELKKLAFENREIANKIRRNTPGERTGKFPIFYVIDKEKAQKFID